MGSIDNCGCINSVVYRSAQNPDSLELGIDPVQMGSLVSTGCSGGGEKKLGNGGHDTGSLKGVKKSVIPGRDLQTAVILEDRKMVE